MENILDSAYERAELIKTVADAAVPERITARVTASISRYGTTRKCLVTTTAAHGYVNGARVYLDGADEAQFNNTTTGLMITVMSPTTFLVFLDGTSSAADVGAGGTCYADIYVRQATVLGQSAAQTNNGGNVRIGSGSANGAQSYIIAPGLEVYLNAGMPPETRVNLGSYYVDVASGGDGVVVLYS